MLWRSIGVMNFISVENYKIWHLDPMIHELDG